MGKYSNEYVKLSQEIKEMQKRTFFLLFSIFFMWIVLLIAKPLINEGSLARLFYEGCFALIIFCSVMALFFVFTSIGRWIEAKLKIEKL